MALRIETRQLRISRRLLAWLLACTLAGALAGYVFVQRSTPRGVTYGVPPQVDLAEHDLGATVDLTLLDQNGRGQLAAYAPCFDVRWLRQPVHWREIEKSPGQFDWPQLKLPLIDASGQRVKILAVLVDTPDWARASNQPASAPPVDRRALGAFARALGEHFKGQIDAYQIWDEPNISAGWGGKYPDAIEYTGLLREASMNLRLADPQVKIVSAALAPTTENGPLNVNEPEYLRQLYRAGAAEFFDAVGAEPFGFWSGPDDRRVDVSTLNFSRVILLREVMEANGDTRKALWATSFGWSIAGTGDSAYGGDDRSVQLERTLNAIERAHDEWPWLGPLMFTRWQPIGAHDPRAGFALVSSNGSPALMRGMPDYCARTRPAPVGRYSADDNSALYPTSWRVTPQGADIPQDDPAPLTISFRGTRLDLTVRRGSYEAFLFVKVDGQPANSLPRDDQGRSYVVLYDPLAQAADVTLARDLPDDVHMVEIKPQGGWGQWSIAGWTVARERGAATWPLVLGALGGAGCGIITLRLWDRTRWLASVALRSPVAIEPLAVPLTFVLGGLLYLSPNVLLSWLLIALLTSLIVWRLDAGLALVALAIPFYLQPKPLGAGSYSVVEIVLLLCVLSFALQRLSRAFGQGTTHDGPGIFRLAWSTLQRLSALDRVVLLWVLAGALGVAVAENFGVANRELRVVFVEPALYYALVRATGMDRYTLVNAFLLGACLVAGKALSDWVTKRDLITAEEGVLRARSVYASPNNLALYLDRAAPLALCLATFGSSRRMLYLIAGVMSLAALYLTFAKGAWLVALPAAFILVGVLRAWQVPAGAKTGRFARMGILLGVLVLLAALGVGLLPLLGTERVSSLFDPTSGSTFIRVQLWQSTLEMIRDHPVFGVGPDNFLYQYRTRYILPSAFAEANLSHPHDILLDFWTRLGLVGVALLAAMLLVFWREALHIYRSATDRDTRALALGLMASMAAALAHGLIDNSFFLVDLAFVLMLTLALIANFSQTRLGDI